MNKDFMEKLVNNMLETGADYSEVYYEDTISKSYNYINGKLDNISSYSKKGISFRIINDNKYYFSSTNNLDDQNLISVSNDLKSRLDGKNNHSYIKLIDERVNNPEIKIRHDDMSTDDKIKYLKRIDDIARGFSDLISQVEVLLTEKDAYKKIANSDGIITNSKEIRTRLFLRIYASNDRKTTNNYFRIDHMMGYEMLNDIDIEKIVIDACKDVIESLDAVDFKGGEYPVIIENGFGALIFHEACGHALEATRVATKESILTGRINEKIASSKVTLIDDGSINKSWGSSIIDDEGEYARKNVLIENGILKSYLVDRFNYKKMNHNFNGSSRRESYLYAPTSRMSNTYLENGTDTIEDMFKSIDYGVYVKGINYGSVQPSTGDFNFYTSSAYIIENGKISKKINNVSLIGNCMDILNSVEMVSNDLKLEGGYCGSRSGSIFITAGQPTIKVSKILIGGKDNE